MRRCAEGTRGKKKSSTTKLRTLSYYTNYVGPVNNTDNLRLEDSNLLLCGNVVVKLDLVQVHTGGCFCSRNAGVVTFASPASPWLFKGKMDNLTIFYIFPIAPEMGL